MVIAVLRSRRLRRAWWLTLWSPWLAARLAAQTPSIQAEREAYDAWLATAPVSPLAAIAQQPIGSGVRLGPRDADVSLEGVSAHRVSERNGALTLESEAGSRALPRGLPVRLGPYTLIADGPAGSAMLTVFGPKHSAKHPTYYPSASPLVFVGPIAPPEHHASVRVLGVDGVEVEAAEAGTVVVAIEGTRTRLLVRRLPTSGGEESELEIFFRDDTNGKGTYPAGRFVALVPEGPGRYRLDFNRARNPFCAYSSVYACPAPWRGNTIPAPVEAGERYADSASVGPGRDSTGG
jgi:hypothetical protein